MSLADLELDTMTSPVTLDNYTNNTTMTTVTTETENERLRILLIVVFLLIFLAGIIANLVIILWHKFFLATPFRTKLITSILLKNFIILIAYPNGILYMWPPRCDSVIITAAWKTAMYAELLIPITLIIEQYVMICHPQRRNVLAKVWTPFVVWIGAFCLAIIQEFEGCKKVIDLISKGTNEVEININLEEIILNSVMYITSAIVFFVLYIKIERNLRTLQTLNVATDESARSAQHELRSRMEMLVWVTTITLVGWFPYHGVALLNISNLFQKMEVVLYTNIIPNLMIFLTTVLHPIICIKKRESRSNHQELFPLRNRPRWSLVRRQRAGAERLAFPERNSPPLQADARTSASAERRPTAASSTERPETPPPTYAEAMAEIPSH